MTAAVARDPRVGLRPNFDFLEAYQIYEKDFPLPKPDISATLAIRSPLFKRIEEGLTEQTQAIAEHQSDQATTRRAAVSSGVPITSLAQMLASPHPASRTAYHAPRYRATGSRGTANGTSCGASETD